jgi:hypothetical protein
MVPFTPRTGPRAKAAVLAGATALAAIGATAVPATASTGSVDIRKVPCTGATFNVYYGANSVACYEGTGELPVQLPRVHQVTTGETTGYFTVISHGALAASNFAPRRRVHAKSRGAPVRPADRHGSLEPESSSIRGAWLAAAHPASGVMITTGHGGCRRQARATGPRTPAG